MLKEIITGWTCVAALCAAQESNLSPVYAERTHAENIANVDTSAASARPEGSIYMGGFRAPKIETVRVAVIGLGERGSLQTCILRLFRIVNW